MPTDTQTPHERGWDAAREAFKSLRMVKDQPTFSETTDCIISTYLRTMCKDPVQPMTMQPVVNPLPLPKMTKIRLPHDFPSDDLPQGWTFDTHKERVAFREGVAVYWWGYEEGVYKWAVSQAAKHYSIVTKTAKAATLAYLNKEKGIKP